MSSPFFQGVVSSLGAHITDAATREREKRIKEEEEEKSVFEALIKSPDRNLQEIGLAGLMEKPKYGWLGKRIPSESRAKVKEYFTKIDEDEKKAVPQKQAPPPPSSYSVNLPPSTVDGMAVVDEPQQSINLQGPPPPPAPSEPEPPPDFSSLDTSWRRKNALNLGAKSPYEDILSQIETLKASGASEDEIREAVKAGMVGKLDPLGTRAGYQKDLKSAEWEFRVAQDAAKHGYKMNEIDAQNMVTLTPSQADRFGLPSGTRLHHRVMSDLTRAGIADDANATRLAVANMIQQGAVTQIRTIDEQGRPITMVVPRREASGVYTSQPSSADESKGTTQQLMKKDIETVKSLYKPGMVGFLKGKKEGAKAYFDVAEPDRLALRDLLERMRTGRLYELSGKAVAEWERRKIGAQVPELETLFASPQKFETQMAGYERAVDNFLAEFRGGEFATPPAAPRKPGGPPAPPGSAERREMNGATYEKRDGPKGRGWYKVK